MYVESILFNLMTVFGLHHKYDIFLNYTSFSPSSRFFSRFLSSPFCFISSLTILLESMLYSSLSYPMFFPLLLSLYVSITQFISYFATPSLFAMGGPQWLFLFSSGEQAPLFSPQSPRSLKSSSLCFLIIDEIS